MALGSRTCELDSKTAKHMAQDPKTDEFVPSKLHDVSVCLLTAVWLITGYMAAHGQRPYEHASMYSSLSNPAFDWRALRNKLHLEQHWDEIFLVGGCFYFPVIFGIRQCMVGRQPFDLRRLLAVWNFIASGLSGYAAYHVIPDLVILVEKHGFVRSLCMPDLVYSSPSAIFIFFFNFTKCLEWIDSVFLALRKKSMGFLHLFHHMVTFAYCWHANVFSYRADSIGAFFAAMNLFVHFIMYGYYGLAALGIKFPYSFLITIMQAVQMAVGLCILGTTLATCDGSWQKNWHGHIFAAGMYGVYLYQFAKLAPEVFARGKKSKSE